MTPRSKISILLCMVAAGLLGGAAALLWRSSPVEFFGRHSSPVALATGSLLSPARALPDFSLIDQRGEPFGPRNFGGRWSLLFFGYTNCPDFCPTTLTTLAAMEKRLKTSGSALRPQVIFVSVDARRDTPQQLAKYVPYFDPEFIGATAVDQKTIETFAGKLGVAVAITPAADGSYTVDHSGAIFVVDPEGRLCAVLTGPFTAEALQADLQRIVAAHG
jgi:protein SCO1/2